MYNLDKRQLHFIKANGDMLTGIFNKRVEELKETILDIEEDKREDVIRYANENKFWIGRLKEINTEVKDNFTGI